MRRAYILAILTFLFTAAPLAAEGPIALKYDSRLQAKVTLKLCCEPVSMLAETLKKATGVSITVRRDVADLNVTAFAADMPAYEVMSRVALVLGCAWEVIGESPGKYGYSLFRPLKKRLEADDLCKAYWREEDQKFRDTIENGIKLVDADSATLRKEAKRNPSQVAQNLMFRETLRDLACFTKAQRDAIWDRIAASPLTEIRIAFTNLPPSLQDRFRKQADERHQDHRSSEQIEKRQLIISRGGGYGSARLSGLPLTSRIAFFGLDGLGGSAGLGSVSTDERLSKFEMRTLQDAGFDTSSIQPPSPDFAAPESKSKRVTIKWPGEDEKEDAPIGFMRVGTAKRQWHSFDQVLHAASAMLKISIFAHDYICRHRNGVSGRTTFPEDLEEAIGEICREFSYEVAYDKDGCIVLQSRTWYIDEAKETPKHLVLRWVDARKKQGKLEFKDYLEITRELDNMRIESLSSARIDGDMPLSREVMHMGENTDRVRLCSMLTADQMKRAHEGGLSYREMKPDQQHQFAYLLCCQRPNLSVLDMYTCLFSVQEEPGVTEQTSPDQQREDSVVFTYTYGPGDEQKFRMDLPEAE